MLFLEDEPYHINYFNQNPLHGVLALSNAYPGKYLRKLFSNTVSNVDKIQQSALAQKSYSNKQSQHLDFWNYFSPILYLSTAKLRLCTSPLQDSSISGPGLTGNTALLMSSDFFFYNKYTVYFDDTHPAFPFQAPSDPTNISLSQIHFMFFFNNPLNAITDARARMWGHSLEHGQPINGFPRPPLTEMLLSFPWQPPPANSSQLEVGPREPLPHPRWNSE